MIHKSLDLLIILLLCFTSLSKLTCEEGIRFFAGFSCVNTKNDYLDKGAKGTIFLVKEDKTNVNYAMKIVSNSQLSKMELKVLLSMKQAHNIIKLKDYFEDFVYTYYILEYAEEKSLLKYGAKELTYQQIMKILRGVVNGLINLHQGQFVHMDIKPENILIKADGTPQLADFDHTLSVNMYFDKRGTEPYMAPETVTPLIKQVNPSMDVYSLGMVLYELVYHMKKSPFDHLPNPAQIKTFKRIGNYPVYKGMPTEILVIIKQMMDPNPESRIKPSQLIQAIDHTIQVDVYTPFNTEDVYVNSRLHVIDYVHKSLLWRLINFCFPYLSIIILSYVFMKRFIVTEATKFEPFFETEIESGYEI